MMPDRQHTFVSPSAFSRRAVDFISDITLCITQIPMAAMSYFLVPFFLRNHKSPKTPLLKKERIFFTAAKSCVLQYSFYI